jgi:hypothetical protein
VIGWPGILLPNQRVGSAFFLDPVSTFWRQREERIYPRAHQNANHSKRGPASISVPLDHVISVVVANTSISVGEERGGIQTVVFVSLAFGEGRTNSICDVNSASLFTASNGN